MTFRDKDVESAVELDVVEVLSDEVVRETVDVVNVLLNRLLEVGLDPPELLSVLVREVVELLAWVDETKWLTEAGLEAERVLITLEREVVELMTWADDVRELIDVLELLSMLEREVVELMIWVVETTVVLKLLIVLERVEDEVVVELMFDGGTY